MGASGGAVMRVFFLTGASIGITGTAIGVVLGLLFCKNIESIRRFLERMLDTEFFPGEVYYLSQLPVRVDWGEVGMIVAMALLLSFVASIYPAWRASRIAPAEALRYE